MKWHSIDGFDIKEHVFYVIAFNKWGFGKGVYYYAVALYDPRQREFFYSLNNTVNLDNVVFISELIEPTDAVIRNV